MPRVLFAVQRHRPNAELAAGAKDSNGNLSSVGDQQLLGRMAKKKRLVRLHNKKKIVLNKALKRLKEINQKRKG